MNIINIKISTNNKMPPKKSKSRLKAEKKERKRNKKILNELGYATLAEAKSNLGFSKKAGAEEVYTQLAEIHEDAKIAYQRNWKSFKAKNKRIKDQSDTLTKTHQSIYDIIKTRPARIVYSRNGKVVRSIDYEKSKFNKQQYTENIVYDWNVNQDSDSMPVWLDEFGDEYEDGELIAYYGTNQLATPERVAQAYRDGDVNCVLNSIMERCLMEMENAKTKGTMLKWKSRYSMAKKDNDKYFEKGVDLNSMAEICENHQISISITKPFQKSCINMRCNKKPRYHIPFLNTRFNHVDLNHYYLTDPINVGSIDELEAIYQNAIKEDDYCPFTQNKKGKTSVYTKNKHYKLNNDFGEWIHEWEKENGINGYFICDYKQQKLSEFVSQGCHFNSVVEFGEEYDFYDYNHIDQERAYINFASNKYYEGFLGKITDFRKCNNFDEVGIYQIENLVLVGWLKEYNEKMNVYNDNVYPSCELKFLKDEGCSFDVIGGCWGSVCDLDFSEEWWLEKTDIKYPKKYNDNKWFEFADRLSNAKGIRHYCKYIGNMFSHYDKKVFYIKGDENKFGDFCKYLDYSECKYYPDFEECKFYYDKTSHKHLSHICSFILAYQRIGVMQQLKTMKIDDVLKVATDGIYYKGEYSCTGIFREKESLLNYTGSGNYVSNFDNCYNEVFADERKHYKKEIYTGCGGCGKTHYNLNDNGLVKVAFAAPSWKLSDAKAQEGLTNIVWESLYCEDPTKWGGIKTNFNVLIIDEVSMMPNDMKELIFERFDDLKIIMCGDIGYQIDPFRTDGKVCKILNFEGFDNVYEMKGNRRVKCNKLLKRLNFVREILREYDPKLVRSWVLDHFNCIKKDENFAYDKKDMILCRTHNVKDTYTEKYKNIDKYYILKNDGEFKKGGIIYDKPEINEKSYELRHAFTVHAIQGETAEGHLYIDMERMYDGKAIYTALSRARYFDQITLLI